MLSKKRLVISLEKFGLKKSLSVGLENIWSQKKSQYRSRKHLVSKKSLSISLENIWSRKKSLDISLENFGLKIKSRYWAR